MNIYGAWRPGEVYLCSIPHGTGHEIIKDRPAVVVSDESFNASSTTVWVVMCSASDHAGRANCVPVSGLERESWALCDQLYTVDKSRLIHYICTLPTDELAAVGACIQRHLPTAEGWQMGPGCITLDQETEPLELTKAKAERDTYKGMYESLLGRILRGGALHMRSNAPVLWRGENLREKAA